VSGWATLARQNPADGLAAGTVFRWCRTRIRVFSRCSSCLTVFVSSAGIHLQPNPLFRFGHDPIFLPRHAVLNFSRKSGWLFHSMRVWVENKDGGSPISLVINGWGLTDSLEQQFQP